MDSVNLAPHPAKVPGRDRFYLEKLEQSERSTRVVEVIVVGLFLLWLL